MDNTWGTSRLWRKLALSWPRCESALSVVHAVTRVAVANTPLFSPSAKRKSKGKKMDGMQSVCVFVSVCGEHAHAPLTFRCLSFAILSLDICGCWFFCRCRGWKWMGADLPHPSSSTSSSSSLHPVLSSASPPPQLQPLPLKFKIKGMKSS